MKLLMYVYMHVSLYLYSISRSQEFENRHDFFGLNNLSKMSQTDQFWASEHTQASHS